MRSHPYLPKLGKLLGILGLFLISRFDASVVWASSSDFYTGPLSSASSAEEPESDLDAAGKPNSDDDFKRSLGKKTHLDSTSELSLSDIGDQGGEYGE